MKKIQYGVAMSLDGYAAGPKGEADWIVPDPHVNFAEIWSQFDTGLMGRKTYQPAVARLEANALQGMKVVVLSRTMKPAEHKIVEIISDLIANGFKRCAHGKERTSGWRRETFRALLEPGEADTAEVSVIPVLLGGGVPLSAAFRF